MSHASAETLQIVEAATILNLVFLISVQMYKRASPLMNRRQQRRRAYERRRAARRVALAAAVQASLDGKSPEPQGHRNRKQRERADYFQSIWWKYCTESAAEIFGEPTSVVGKTFRRRPWAVFWEIYQEALHMNWFPQHNPGK
jgi:hypothetical protein